MDLARTPLCRRRSKNATASRSRAARRPPASRGHLLRRRACLHTAHYRTRVLRALAIPKEVTNGIRKSSTASAPRSQQLVRTSADGLRHLFNRRACTERGIPVPTTWDDLTRPEISAGCVWGPERSGSSTTCLDLIVQRYGWTDGWAKSSARGEFACARVRQPGDSALVRTGDAWRAGDEFTAAPRSSGPAATASPTSTAGATRSRPTPSRCFAGRASGRREAVRGVLPDALGAGAVGVAGGQRSGPRTNASRHPIRPDVYETYTDRLVVHDTPFTSRSISSSIRRWRRPTCSFCRRW